MGLIKAQSLDDVRRARQEWRTPEEFWRVIDDEFEFELDAAASNENALCDAYIDQERDALASEWFTEGVRAVYSNPGFGNMMPWVKKSVSEIQKAEYDVGYEPVIVLMALVAPSTDWWWEAMKTATSVRLLRPRVQFVPADGIKMSSNARENCLIIWDWAERSYRHGMPRVWTWEWKRRGNGHEWRQIPESMRLPGEYDE